MIFLINFLLCILIKGEGFAPQTLVKVPHGYCTIQSLQVNDLVVCHDIKTGKNYTRPITAIKKTKQNSYFVRFNTCWAISGHDQLIYIPILEQWITIQQLLDQNFLSKQTFIKKVLPFKSETLISLTVAEHHNFYITTDDILVHNVPVIFVAVAAESILPLIISSGAFTGVIAYLGIEAFREHKKKKKIEHNNDENEPRAAAGGAGRPPDDPNDPYKNKDKERFNRRDPDHHITNKEAREVAKELGYWEVKNPPFNTHGALAFKKGFLYITADNTAHKGGYWKLVKVIGTTVTRLGTYDKSLKTKFGE